MFIKILFEWLSGVEGGMVVGCTFFLSCTHLTFQLSVVVNVSTFTADRGHLGPTDHRYGAGAWCL